MKSFATLALAAATLTTTTDANSLRVHRGMSKHTTMLIQKLAAKYDCEAAGDIVQTVENIVEANTEQIAHVTETCTQDHSERVARLEALNNKLAADNKHVDDTVAAETVRLLGII